MKALLITIGVLALVSVGVVFVGGVSPNIVVAPEHVFTLGGVKITFAANPIGKGCIFCWTAAGWTVVGNNGGTIA